MGIKAIGTGAVEMVRNVVNFSNQLVCNFSIPTINECSTSSLDNYCPVDLFGFQTRPRNFLNYLGVQEKVNGEILVWFPARGRLPFAGIGFTRHQKQSLGSKTRSADAVDDGHEKADGNSKTLASQENLLLRTETGTYDDSIADTGLREESWMDVDLQVHAKASVGGAVSKEELGRSTWTFLHSLAAQFPDKPSKQQQKDVKELMMIMSRIYPCKECADHFKEVLKAHPVDATSGEQLAQWMCRVHNVVNRSLGKGQFPCQRVDARWGAMDCDEGVCSLQGRLYR